MLCASFSVLPSSSFCLFLALQTLFFHNRFCCNLSNFLLSLGPYVFVLVRYHFESHLSLFVLHLMLSISTNLLYFFFFWSLTDSMLALVHHPSPHLPFIFSCSQRHTLTQTHTHPPLSLGAACTCVPCFGLDMARVSAVESWKCSSCLIRRYNGRQHEDGQEKTYTNEAHTAFRRP